MQIYLTFTCPNGEGFAAEDQSPVLLLACSTPTNTTTTTTITPPADAPTSAPGGTYALGSTISVACDDVFYINGNEAYFAAADDFVKRVKGVKAGDATYTYQYGYKDPSSGAQYKYVSSSSVTQMGPAVLPSPLAPGTQYRFSLTATWHYGGDLGDVSKGTWDLYITRQACVTQAPTQAPTLAPTAAPVVVTQAPVTAAPAVPATLYPVTAAPVTTAPVTAAPATAAPVTAAPVTAAPAQSSPPPSPPPRPPPSPPPASKKQKGPSGA